MELKTYRAASMQQALQMVRRELGPDAAVLHTREIKPGIFRWFVGRRGFEVVASREVQVASRLPATRFSPPVQREELPARDLELDDFAMRARSKAHDELKSQISDLQAMVERLCRSTNNSTSAELPPGLFTIYTDLIEAEASEATARQLADRIRRDASAADLQTLEGARDRLVQILEQDIQACGPIRPTAGHCQVVALVGPTGVGKTTTIAKLAANFRLREKIRVGLITVDTYRVAAVEQLRTYAEIIDLPMEVVATPREMRAAVEKLSEQDLVLVDTAGRSPADEVKIQELRSLLNEAKPDQVHLVLSSAASGATLRRIAERFAPAGPSAFIFTKLDEALSLGNLIELLTQVRLPISYLTNGQNVPDDIQAADTRRLVRQILRLDRRDG